MRCVPGSRCGFTLVELTVSLVVLAVLAVAIGSTVVVASHALPAPDGTGEAPFVASRALDEFTEDLLCAERLLESAPTAVAVVVADRDGDGTPERIRYHWADDTGGPLMRTVGDGEPVPIVPDVSAFELGFDVRGVVETYPGPANADVERPLAGRLEPAEAMDGAVTAATWLGQRIRPVFDPAVVAWSLSRVTIRMRAAGAPDGSMTIQVRGEGPGGLPGAVLAEARLDESALGTEYTWQSFDLPVADLLPGVPVYVLVVHEASAVAGELALDGQGGGGLVATSSGGATFAIHPQASLLYEAYGTTSTAGPPQDAVRRRAFAVTGRLETGENALAAQRTSVRLLNAPVRLVRQWSLEFDADPRTVDGDADGVADWRDETGTHASGSLVDGVWRVDATLVTTPAHAFTGLTTIAWRGRAALPGSATVVRAELDVTSGRSLTLESTLRRDDDGRQRLVCKTAPGTADEAVAAVAAGLSGDMVDVRMIVDPDHRTVAVFVEGVHRRTVLYDHRPTTARRGAVRLSGEGAGAELDGVVVRAGGR